MNQIRQIDLQLCYPANKARDLDDAAVKALAESIDECGLINPIVVRPAKRSRGAQTCDVFEVIAGMHRVKACRKLGRETIAAFVVEADDLRAELMRIDENLCRAELGPAERAGALRRRKLIYLELYPQTRHGSTASKSRDAAGRLQKSENPISGEAPRSFVDATAASTGLHRDTVAADVARAEKLGDDTLARVAGTSLDKGVELDALAKLTPEDRAPLIARAAAGEQVTARPSPQVVVDNVVGRHELDLRRICKIWDEICPSARDAFLSKILAEDLSGLQRQS